MKNANNKNTNKNAAYMVTLTTPHATMFVIAGFGCNTFVNKNNTLCSKSFSRSF